MIITITGGSGFVGTEITKRLVARGDSVIILDPNQPRITDERVRYVQTDFTDDTLPDDVVDVDAVIHLAGVSVFKRWTPAYKTLILESRVQPIKKLRELAQRPGKRPRVFVSASAVGWYGNDCGDRLLDETVPAGSDFLASVCSQWESEARTFETLGSRVVSIRTAIVLGPGGGMMSQVLPIFRWGLGGTFGSGKQWFSWIHIDDLVSVYLRAIDDVALSGPVNASAPYPVTNREFSRAVGKALHRPVWFRVPGWVLRVILGQFAGAVLGSQRAIPAKLQQNDFRFSYETVDVALRQVTLR